jgi:hypothetical protein
LDFVLEHHVAGEVRHFSYRLCNITSPGKRKVLPVDDVPPMHEVHGPSFPIQTFIVVAGKRIESYPEVRLSIEHWVVDADRDRCQRAEIVLEQPRPRSVREFSYRLSVILHRG